MRRVSVLLATMAAILLLALSGSTVSASAQSSQDPTQLIIRTIPPIPGIDVMLDGQTATTNVFGAATIQTTNLRNLAERVRPAQDEYTIKDGAERVEYSRLYRLDKYDYALAFDVHKPVTFAFTDTHGDVVEPDVIESTNLKNRLGEFKEDIPLERPVWLFASRVVSSQNGPEVRDIEWSIESVMVRDTNVVNRAQIRFFPTVESHIDVEVLFFSARFKVADMFFGFPQGDALTITYPDGEIISHELDSNGEVFLKSVPRGEYEVNVEGSGPSIPRPVALSRDQDVDLSFLSWLDIALVALAGLIFLTIPVLLGRGWRRRRHRQDERAKAAERDEPDESDEMDESDGSDLWGHGDHAADPSEDDDQNAISNDHPAWEEAFR